MLRPQVDPAARAAAPVLATGRAASPGVVSGVVVTDVDEAEERALGGEDVILARTTTSPDDVHAMEVVKGIVTEVGGATSHAAVVSRELDVACVVGCGAGTVTRFAGRTVTVDADNGEVLDGMLPAACADEDGDSDLATLKAWAIAEGWAGTLAQMLLARTRSRTASDQGGRRA
jgi:pyruvate,orthophosphate dikinase